MKFADYPYVRPNMKELQDRFNALVEEFNCASGFEQQDKAMEAINDLRNEFESMKEIASVRHTVDTADEFYRDEQDFFDTNIPSYQELVSKYYESLVNSKFRDELEKKWGKQLFIIANLTLKTFSPEIMEDLALENRLRSDYTKLTSSARIMFEGEERNLSGIIPFMQSKNRETRKKAHEARYAFFKEYEEKFDRIYDDLVKVRTRIANKLGYENYIELGYARLFRSDYNSKMVADFRKQVRQFIVPVATRLRERQRKRLGLDKLKYYDEKVSFKEGNAIPKGNAQWILDNGKRMYSELSAETGEYFKFMTDNCLMDLETKKNKAGGGYCTYISEYKAPFIFSNFNGTSGDIDVLTHEAGHAFQCYCSRDYKVPEYAYPTLEACEIHSMSMEFFTWPWMNLFFEEDADKYRFSHLSEALLFIPYGVTVDEFQHFVYEHPEASPAERKRAWREIEKIYLPHRDYEDNDYLNRGGYWYQQGHIFGTPFYYIDYTLAQVCAFQFWIKANKDRKKAWADYLNLCREGGSKSFVELVDVAKLVSPFNESCVEPVIKEIQDWLDKVDDLKL